MAVECYGSKKLLIYENADTAFYTVLVQMSKVAFIHFAVKDIMPTNYAYLYTNRPHAFLFILFLVHLENLSIMCYV